MNLKLPNLPTVAMQPPPRSAEPHGPPSSGVRPLSERQLKNQRKRVHLHSKRLRQLWPTIASYLDLKSAVALASSCRRLQVVLRDETVWCVRGSHGDCSTTGWLECWWLMVVLWLGRTRTSACSRTR